MLHLPHRLHNVWRLQLEAERAVGDLYSMGVSAISGFADVYTKNWRDLPRYNEAINAGLWPTMRGVRVSAEDKLQRLVINRILCHRVLMKSEVEPAVRCYSRWLLFPFGMIQPIAFLLAKWTGDKLLPQMNL